MKRKRFFSLGSSASFTPVAIVLFVLSLGCSVLTEFDRDKIGKEENSGAVSVEGDAASERSVPVRDTGQIESSQIESSTPATDSGNGESSLPPINDDDLPCYDPEDCPTFSDPCFETECIDGKCVPTKRAPDTECDAECGTIVDECNNVIECGRCEAGEVCLNNSCVSECGGCEIDGICYDVGAANPSNPCEVCSPTNSETSWASNDGVLCDDGRFCTVADSCIDAECRGTERNCDDGIDCNGTETCSEADHSCKPGTPTCGENQYCNAASNSCVSICGGADCIINNTCYQDGAHNAANVCLVCDRDVKANDWTIAVGITCGDSVTECSGVDTCDASGNCVTNNAPRGTHCGSGATECSAQDTCDGEGNCSANHRRWLTPCGTHGECENQDYCDGAGQCVDGWFVWMGTPCGDAKTACSGQDSCDGWGRCQPNHLARGTYCGDIAGTVCSWNVCNGSGACNQVSNVKRCDDGNVCTSNDCEDRNGKCQPGDFDDDKECSADSFSCTDDRCSKGTCTATRNNSRCNDHKPCTDDSCDPTANGHDSNGCVFRPDDSNPCSDNFACTTDGCSNGNCVGTPVNSNCDDRKPCTDDICDPTASGHDSNGCVFITDNTNDCTDNVICTDDRCDDGRCISTSNCNDNSSCTDDRCDPANSNLDSGCVFEPNGSCTDGVSPQI
ncbi:MAG: hypothetical protein JXA30_14375 [Deltaproteobacteria bacterium]|nr:hypothetical protein [Deltaproteobacteria bacterium]